MSSLPTAQEYSWNCGPACLANAMCILGVPVTPEEALGHCRPLGRGTSEDELVTGARRLGFKPMVRQVRRRAQMRRLYRFLQQQTKMGRLAIVSINGHGTNGHWVLILRAERLRLHVWDPSDNLSKTVPLRNFLSAWWCTTDVPSYRGEEAQIDYDCAWAVSLSPRTHNLKRAVAIRANLLKPPAGRLPTDK